MALRLIAASQTDVGKQREQNEDACFSEITEHDAQTYGLFIVADGMGGYRAGEVASKIAVETISETLRSLLGPVSAQTTVRLNRRGRGRGGKSGKQERTKEPAEATPSADVVEAREAPLTQQLAESVAIEHYTNQLKAAVRQASKAIVEYGNEHKDARGLGSTLTAALVIGERLFIANVGDSRTYLLRAGTLQRITLDHSLVERLVQAEQIDREEVYEHPSRNLIYRSLGAGHAEVEVDIFVEQLQVGDALLLCSDGLWEMVRDPELTSILTDTRELAEACDLLIKRANEHGGEDNITAVLVRCLEG
ncbi:MAG: serine/threonine-protein phosphatase [Ktedonobacterales bacterium]|nr:serine/threonine-protein phosphatase [Ktedonobacterales bacterium]